jgi:gamma-butyrobetaine dioxygenase
VSAVVADDVVTVTLANGRTAAFHRLALRDACPCAQCRHPVSGQRLFESRDVVPDARISAASLDGGTLVVEWSNGHRSTFDEEWLTLEADALDNGARRPRPITLWGSELADRLPTESYTDVVGHEYAFGRWLDELAEYGFSLLTGAPVEEDAVAGIAELFGHVRVTNYGRIFDVNVRADASNLADTASALSLHTDNPYREPTPGLQLLQCLVSSVAGGDSIVADGFRAVARLSPDKLDVLVRQPIRYAYRDEGAELWADVPVVTLDAAGAPAAVHLNNRSKGVPVGTPDAVARWYEAYFELVALLDSPDAQVVFRLDPGDVAVFDNLRVLHARTAFAGEGVRRLQGCYADRDALFSRLGVLARAGAR